MKTSPRVVVAVLLAMFGGARNTGAASSPLSPDQALASFQVEPGLKAELVAAEPLVVAPCALAWDEQERLYVAENRGYPTGGSNGAAIGMVALLKDTDGDGRVDQRTVFADGLTFPNGLMPWRGGLIVTCAPDVYFFKDTNGDGKADLKEVLLTGFATNLTTQLRVNRPLLAPDGWVYLASGLSGGRITSPKRPDQAPLDLKGDIRFRPDTGEYEGTDGKSQFGQSFDDFGRRFGVFNRVQVQHFVLPSRYVERNPHLASPGVMQNCPELLDNPFMRGGGAAARLYPISENVTTADSHAGTFTAACAVHLYGGGALPARYEGHVFSCDPTGNLVHEDRLRAAGATFAAERTRENSEFLRSPDGWFRPVYLDTGPEGALYVCDMYRKVIEHPEYLPVETRKHTDFESGRDRGRIWRVTSAGASASAKNRAAPRLAGAAPPQLATGLDSTNAWVRQTAFRLLLEQNERATPELLKAGFSRTRSVFGIARRLELLALLGELDDALLSRALASSTPVREVAARLSEARVGSASVSPDLLRSLKRNALNDEPRVRFQVALVLGTLLKNEKADERDKTLEALAQLARRDGADKWTRAAVFSSLAGQEQAFFHRLAEDPPPLPALWEELGQLLASATGPEERRVLWQQLLAKPAMGFDVKAAMVSGLSGAQPEFGPRLNENDEQAEASWRALLAEALQHLANSSAPLSRRSHSMGVLSLAGTDAANAALLARLQPGEPIELQALAVRALARPQNAAGVRALLQRARWASLLPPVQNTVLASVLSRPEHLSTLLTALEEGDIPLSALDSNRREQLKKAKDEPSRQRAAKLFSNMNVGDRAEAFDRALACLSLKPVPAHGHEIFRKLCATCHRLEREGVAVGPDLFDVRNQPKETLLLHIVIPEREIAPNFTSYICETKDGRTVSGLIASESPASVVFRQAQGVEETIPRANIATLTASRLSLMPQELEKSMSLQEMADLLAYLKGESP
jgi:putative membrane-bound dehydrogenase-like protein